MKIDVIKESDDPKDNGPKFYEFLDYYGMYRVSKEKLKASFERFLEDPLMYHGYFLVYCSEDDGLYNRTEPKEQFDNIVKYMKKQRQENPDDPWEDKDYD